MKELRMVKREIERGIAERDVDALVEGRVDLEVVESAITDYYHLSDEDFEQNWGWFVDRMTAKWL